MEKAVHLRFKGMVQGVGFRFTARDLAYRYKIKGWVMNMPDGCVEVVAEGKANNLNNFLKDLQDELRSYITNLESKELPSSGKYEDFQIRFS